MRVLTKRIFLACCLLALLQGCAGTPEVKPIITPASQLLIQQHLQSIASINQFSLRGRIGVQTEGKGFSGSLVWQHDDSHDSIDLYSPLGSQVASIKKTADQVTLLDAKGNSISAENTEALTLTALGWRLPLSGLVDWSLGRPAGSTVQAITWNDQGFLSTLKQDGWDIQYQDYIENNGLFLPRKILLKSEKVNLKLLVEEWLTIGEAGKNTDPL